MKIEQILTNKKGDKFYVIYDSKKDTFKIYSEEQVVALKEYMNIEGAEGIGEDANEVDIKCEEDNIEELEEIRQPVSKEKSEKNYVTDTEKKNKGYSIEDHILGVRVVETIKRSIEEETDTSLKVARYMLYLGKNGISAHNMIKSAYSSTTEKSYIRQNEGPTKHSERLKVVYRNAKGEYVDYPGMEFRVYKYYIKMLKKALKYVEDQLNLASLAGARNEKRLAEVYSSRVNEDLNCGYLRLNALKQVLVDGQKLNTVEVDGHKYAVINESNLLWDNLNDIKGFVNNYLKMYAMKGRISLVVWAKEHLKLNAQDINDFVGINANGTFKEMTIRLWDEDKLHNIEYNDAIIDTILKELIIEDEMHWIKVYTETNRAIVREMFRGNEKYCIENKIESIVESGALIDVEDGLDIAVGIDLVHQDRNYREFSNTILGK